MRRAFLFSNWARAGTVSKASRPMLRALIAAYALKGVQKREESDDLLGRLSTCWSPSGKGFIMTPRNRRQNRQMSATPQDRRPSRWTHAANQHAYRTTAMLGVTQVGAHDGRRSGSGAIFVDARHRPDVVVRAEQSRPPVVPYRRRRRPGAFHGRAKRQKTAADTAHRYRHRGTQPIPRRSGAASHAIPSREETQVKTLKDRAEPMFLNSLESRYRRNGSAITLVAAFRNRKRSDPNLEIRISNAIIVSRSLCKAKAAIWELGVTSSKGEFYPVAHFGYFRPAEDAEEAFRGRAKSADEEKRSTVWLRFVDSSGDVNRRDCRSCFTAFDLLEP